MLYISLRQESQAGMSSNGNCVFFKSGGELLELLLLETQLVNTFWPIRAVFTFLTTG
jgi:hypothetical protein